MSQKTSSPLWYITRLQVHYPGEGKARLCSVPAFVHGLYSRGSFVGSGSAFVRWLCSRVRSLAVLQCPFIGSAPLQRSLIGCTPALVHWLCLRTRSLAVLIPRSFVGHPAPASFIGYSAPAFIHWLLCSRGRSLALLSRSLILRSIGLAQALVHQFVHSTQVRLLVSPFDGFEGLRSPDERLDVVGLYLEDRGRVLHRSVEVG